VSALGRAMRWGRALLLLAGAAAIGYLVYEIGPQAVWDSFRTLGWGLLAVVTLPHVISVALDTLGWRALLRDHRVPFSVLLRARLAGEAVNLVTPTASVGGEPLKAYLLQPYVPLTTGFGSVVIDKTTVVAGQALLLLVGLILSAWILPLHHPLMLAMGALLAVEVVAVGGFILVQMSGIFGGGARMLGRFGLSPRERYQSGLNTVDRWIKREYREHPGPMIASTLLHGAGWAAGGIEIYLFLVFTSGHGSLLASLVIEAFGAAVKFASFMIPASLGALEGGYVAIFGALGLGGAMGLSYTLIRRLREVFWAAIGLIWLATLRARPSLADREDAAIAEAEPS